MRTRLRSVTVVAVIVAVFFVGRALGAGAGKEPDPDSKFFVPVLASPSVQLANGQIMLLKLTNMSDQEVGIRVMLFNDRQGVPAVIKDFPQLDSRTTVTYTYTPPPGTLVINETSLEAPDAVRALIGPMPAGNPKVMRNVVANLQLLRLQSAQGTAAALTESPTIVPLSGCRDEPRGLVPYRHPTMSWNCTPTM